MGSHSRSAVLALAFILPTLANGQEQATAIPPPAYPPSAYAPPSPPGSYGSPVGSDPRAYIGLKLGAIVPKHKDMEGYDNGFAIEGAIGYRANDNVALELSLGRFSISGTFRGVVSGVPVTVTEDVVGYPVLGTLRLIAPAGPLELFGLFGGGLYFLSDEVEATAPGYAPLSETDSDSPFGFHFGGGLNVRLAPNARLGAEVKYIIGTVDLFDTKANFDSIIVGGALTFTL